MDRQPNADRVQSPFARPREPAILVAVIAAVLLIATLKPWSLGEGASSDGEPKPRGAIPSGSDTEIRTPPSPVAAPAILDPNGMPCLSDTTEQVVVIERWAGHEVRSWVAAVDTPASGPLDDRLVPIPFFSTRVIGLGICAPRAQVGPQLPAARLLDVRSVVQTDAGPRAVDLGLPDPISLQVGGTDDAVLYGAPVDALPSAPAGPIRTVPGVDPSPTELPRPTPDSGTGPASPVGGWATWPTGSYALAFQFRSDGPRVVRWLRINLIQGAGGAG